MNTLLKDVCQTCLSNDRILYPLHTLSSVLCDLGVLLKKDLSSGVCWECKGILLKILRFKLQVLKAQDALLEVAKHQDLKSLSKLAIHNKFIYDLEVQHCDPLINTETESIELKKEEDVPDTFVDESVLNVDVINIEYDKLADSCNTQINNVINKTKLKMKNVATKRVKANLTKKQTHLPRRKINFLNSMLDNEVRDKYTTVVFTEEEMLKNREEKRNQPNFKKIPYKCETCVLGFIRKETYNLHMEKKHDMDIGTYTCDVCQSRFTSSKSLERHRRKHYVVYRCKLCEYETLELWSALSHCRVKHSGDTNGRIHCPQCSNVFRSSEALTEHIRNQHSLRCNECGDKFKGKHTLRTHKIRIHGAMRDFRCDECCKTFKTKSRLESHVISHNTTLAMKLAYCAVCNVQYKNIYVYRNHLKNSTNHSERVYECNECNKKFASKVYLRKHCDFYHLHKSQYKCEICNKLFISDWRLKNHRQTHHGLTRSRNHACNVCGKKFFTLSTLRGHQLTHSEERSYMCEDCGDTFKQRPALYTHSRLVHKGGKRSK